MNPTDPTNDGVGNSPAPEQPAANPGEPTPPSYPSTPPTVDAWGTPQNPMGDPAAHQPGNPYGQVNSPQAPNYGAQANLTPEHPQSVLILILGILGLVLCQLCAPFAWFMGSKARKEAKEQGYRESTALTVGWILGIVGTALLAGLILLFGALFTIGAFTAATSYETIDAFEQCSQAMDESVDGEWNDDASCERVLNSYE